VYRIGQGAPQFLKMLYYARKFAHGALLTIVFLLAVGTNPTCLSIDNDGDDATPAVNVELNFALPSEKLASLEKAQRATLATVVMIEPSRQVTGFSQQDVHAPETTSLPLIVPLRT
jgi:hypothetical protein